MANRTDASALQVHGTDPQFLIEKILRERIHTSNYWKAYCFGLNAATILDEVRKLNCIGGMIGVGGEGAPTNFLCLLLKLLQIQPEKEIILEYIKQDHYKLLRLLAAFYLRLTGSSLEIYTYLEPLYYDCRAVYYQLTNGKFQRVFMDECIHELLKREKFCDVSLPKIAKREVLEEQGKLQPRESILVQMVENDTQGQQQLESLDAMQEEHTQTVKEAGEETKSSQAKTTEKSDGGSSDSATKAAGEDQPANTEKGHKLSRRNEERGAHKRGRGRSHSHSRSRSSSRSRSRSGGRRRKSHGRRDSRSRSRSGSHGRRHHRHHRSPSSSTSRSPGRKPQLPVEKGTGQAADETKRANTKDLDNDHHRRNHSQSHGRHRSHHHRRHSSSSRSRSRSRSHDRGGSRSGSRGHNHSHGKDRKRHRDPHPHSSANGDAAKKTGKDEMQSSSN